jgi:subtilisin family serine protease
MKSLLLALFLCGAISCSGRKDNNGLKSQARPSFRCYVQGVKRLFLVRTALPLIGILAILAGLLPTRPLYAQAPESAGQILAPISPGLDQAFARSKTPLSFLVILDDQVDAQAVLQAAQVSVASPHERGAVLYAELTETARRTQAPLRAWLDANKIPYQAFYLVNMLEVYADRNVAELLRRRGEVARLAANPMVNGVETSEQANRPQAFRSRLQRIDPFWTPPFSALGFAQPWLPQLSKQIIQTQEQTPQQTAVDMPYGLTFTNADDVWALGYTGQGIVIASQDTGVEWEHPALKADYRGYATSTQSINHIYNWFDYWGIDRRPSSCAMEPSIPCDDDGHGTHTVGTILGDATGAGNTILGMAPSAQWIACRNMRGGDGTPASYTACFEFFLAPYPQDGDKFSEGRPDLAPNIVNNSWGCPPSEGCDANSLRQVVETIRAAGIMIVSSAGNKGSGCASVQDPTAIYDAVFTVGAHTSSGAIASFSSRGPVTVDGSYRRKPDIAAPGASVRSAGLTYQGNAFNDVKSGTSMAAPHVAGAVALLWSAVPALEGAIDLTEQVFIKSATPVLSNQCDEGNVSSPNNVYGYGRLDVLAAVQMARSPTQGAFTLVGQAGESLMGATVDYVDLTTGFVYTQQAGFDNVANFPVLYTRPNDPYVLVIHSATGVYPSPVLQVGNSATISETIPLGQTYPVYLPLMGK